MSWDPAQYDRFKAQRRAPFADLLALVQPVPGGSAVDLGCGTGELTAQLHRHVRAASTVGVDSSPAMLADADSFAVGERGLRFELADIAAYEGEHDVVFANASLHWLPDHPALLARLAGCLRPRGQLAVQVPASHDHPSHTVVAEIAAEMGIEAARPPVHVLTPGAYAEVLDALGFAEQQARLQVYGHHLASTADVIEWVKGTTLTPIRSHLADDAAWDEFLARYRARLLAVLDDPAGTRPYFYAFSRILFRARLP